MPVYANIWNFMLFLEFNLGLQSNFPLFIELIGGDQSVSIVSIWDNQVLIMWSLSRILQHKANYNWGLN